MSRRSLLWTLGSPVRLGLLGLIGLYRISLGQLAGGRCRFHPSCSAYAEQAIRELGAARGGALAVWRILRCGPWTAGGVDYPPGYDHLIHVPPGSVLAVYDTIIPRPLERARTDGKVA